MLNCSLIVLICCLMAFPGGQEVSSKYCNTSCIFCPEYVDGFLMTVPSEEGSLGKALEKYPMG